MPRNSLPPERLTYSQKTAAPTSDATNTVAIAGLVCGCIAFLILPLVFGPVGVIFSAVGLGRKAPMGVLALVVSLAGLVVGLLLGLAVVS